METEDTKQGPAPGICSLAEEEQEGGQGCGLWEGFKKEGWGLKGRR